MNAQSPLSQSEQHGGHCPTGHGPESIPQTITQHSPGAEGISQARGTPPAAPVTLDALALRLDQIDARLAQLVATTPAPKRIEPDGIYTPNEAAALIPFSALTIRHFCRIERLKSKGPPYKIRGAELLKLGGKLDAKA